MGRQQSDQVVELLEPGAATIVRRDREVVLLAQDVGDERGQIRRRSDLDENPRTVPVQGLHRLPEANGAGPMRECQLSDGLGIVRHPGCGHTGVERDLRDGESGIRVEPLELVTHRREERRVVGPTEGQLLADGTLSPKLLLDPGDRFGAAPEHGLVRAVVHRQIDVALRLGRQGSDHLRIGRSHRQQHAVRNEPAGLGSLGGPVALEDVMNEVIPILDPCRPGGQQRGVLTGAVTDDHVRPHADRRQHRVHGLVGGEHRFDGAVHLPEALLFRLRAARDGEDRLAGQHTAVMVPKGTIHQIEPIPRFGEVNAEVGQHARILRSFARKQQGELAFPPERPGEEIDPGALANAPQPGIGELRCSEPELRAEVGRILRDDGQRGGGLRAPRGVHGIGEIPELELRIAVEESERAAAAIGDFCRAVTVDRDDLRLPAPGQAAAAPVGRAHVLVRSVLLEDRVAVDAPESKGADGGAASVIGPVDPRPRLRRQIEGCGGEGRIRAFGVQGRGDDAVVDGERGLDEPGGAGGGYRVPDHRLDRTERTPRPAVGSVAEDELQRSELGLVPDRGRRAVRLDESDRVGGNPGVGVGAPHGELFALDPGSQQAHGAAIARRADALDDCVDPVPVGLGVGQALENENTGAFAEQRAVRLGVEGTNPSAPRQGPELREEDRDRVGRGDLDRPDQRQIAGAGREIPHSQVGCDQCRGARRVDGIGGTHDVQPIGNAPTHD